MDYIFKLSFILVNIQKFRNNRYSFITKLNCNAVTDPLVNTGCVVMQIAFNIVKKVEYVHVNKHV